MGQDIYVLSTSGAAAVLTYQATFLVDKVTGSAFGASVFGFGFGPVRDISFEGSFNTGFPCVDCSTIET